MVFKDRLEAGTKLAKSLEKFRGDKKAIVLGLPRGGMVTAFEVAKIIHLPLDLIAPRKIGAPSNPEYAIGAVTIDGEKILNEAVIAESGISRKYVDEEIKKQIKEAERREKVYRGDRPPLDLLGKTAILVDDGIATGSTMRAAIKSSKKRGAVKVIVAVPVIAPDTLEIIKKECDEVIYLDAPELFAAVGQFYEIFDQVEDEQVIELMNKSLKI